MYELQIKALGEWHTAFTFEPRAVVGNSAADTADAVLEAMRAYAVPPAEDVQLKQAQPESPPRAFVGPRWGG